MGDFIRLHKSHNDVRKKELQMTENKSITAEDKEFFQKTIMESINEKTTPISLAESLIELLGADSSPFPVVACAKMLGISVYEQDIREKVLKGYLAVDKKDTPIICVNKNESIGHNRYTVAHELWHYLYDYKFKKRKITLYAESEHDDEDKLEKDADAFAVNLLMPKDTFLKEAKSFSSYDPNIIVERLCNRFGVSQTAVIRRLRDVYPHMWFRIVTNI